MSKWDFNEKPLLVFWETTIACQLRCRHCRASAIPEPPPDQLTTVEGSRLIDQVAAFGRPFPILILTGGDLLMRPDIFSLIDDCVSRGIAASVSPSVTPLLSTTVLDRFKEAGVAAISFSLDGAEAATHDSIRGVEGTWDRTVTAIRHAAAIGLKVQINTTVMPANLLELPHLFELIHTEGADIWEVFFLIQSGRGREIEEISPDETEEVMRFLTAAARYGMTVRTVEGPFFRRVVREHREGRSPHPGPLAASLIADLSLRLGPPTAPPAAQTMATRDGKGILFVNYRGEVYPSGFFPLVVGNVRTTPLAEIYRTSPILVQLREGTRLKGRCGRCEYRDLCGGARARAYAATGDPFEEDPACPYLPAATSTPGGGAL